MTTGRTWNGHDLWNLTVAGQQLAAAEPAAASPGPFNALTTMPTPCGAVPIEDANGDIIGWSTDHAGHTSETTMPEGLTPEQIAANARLFAASPDMMNVLARLAAIEPVINARLMIAGQSADQELFRVAEYARQLRAAVFGPVDPAAR